MKLVLVGTGNVAFSLSRILILAGHSIVEIYGRNVAALHQLSQITGAKVTTKTPILPEDVDVCLLTVSDSAIADVAEQVNAGATLVAHTSGATSMEVLSRFENYGVLYPLQSLRKEMTEVPQIPFFVDGNSSQNIERLQKLASSTGNRVTIADDETRLKLHAAAVLCSNFTNHLYALTEWFCKKEEIDFKNVLPLIEETANRLQFFSPAQMQTGPAIRKDEVTIGRHLQLFSVYPEIQMLYEMLTQSILNFSEKTYKN